MYVQQLKHERMLRTIADLCMQRCSSLVDAPGAEGVVLEGGLFAAPVTQQLVLHPPAEELVVQVEQALRQPRQAARHSSGHACAFPAGSLHAFPVLTLLQVIARVHQGSALRDDAQCMQPTAARSAATHALTASTNVAAATRAEEAWQARR
jgi:hypothetical protein